MPPHSSGSTRSGAGAGADRQQGTRRARGPGDDHGPVAEGPVLAYAADAGRERLAQDQVGEHLPRVGPEAVGRGPLVAAVEVAQEVATVAPVEYQQGRRLAERPQREPHA